VGDFPKTTDACAGCHRAHRGQAEKLLKESSQQALCFSCHGTGATGADTNVQDGVYLQRDGVSESPPEGVENAGLRGGGFDNAVMDPDLDLTVASAPVTSKHNVGTTDTIWGWGSIGSGPGKTDYTLECGSCHNPHGFSDGDRYRILRPIPKGSQAASGVDVTDEQNKYYTVTYWTSEDLVGYRDLMAHKWMDRDREKQLSAWCAQCHTRYLAEDFTGTGDPIFNHRHATHVAAVDAKGKNFLVCQTCHVAHGTSATMGTYSGAVEWPDDTSGGGVNDSRLLHVNNRGVCIQCHRVPGEPNGCIKSGCHTGP